MANNTRTTVGGGLGTIRAAGAKRFEATFIEGAEAARRARHTRTCQAMHDAARKAV